MTRQADHEERRRQIADALLRIAGTRGLHAAGMRDIAAEAGVSVHLIQYYFGTKEQLLLYTAQHLARQLSERVRAWVQAAGGTPDPRTVIDGILTEALPTDEQSRLLHVVYTSYFALALTDPALTIQPQVGNSDAVIDVVFGQLRTAQQAGQMPAHLDAHAEAISLLAMSAGLGSSVLAGQGSVDEALAIIRYHLDRLLPAPRLENAPRQSPSGT